MSLKAFHIFFISVSILFSAWFGRWALVNDFAVYGIVSIIGTVSLIAYLIYFLKKSKQLGFLVLFFSLVPEPALACAACFGNAESPMVIAANAGMAVLLGIIVVVLIGFASLFLYWARRAKKLGL